jgi:NDP-sugar pyrophosphorylase family protein
MQCVILAGGLGTRMRPLTDACPKTLLEVSGRPFAYHQLHWLAARGVDDVIYCIGHQGDMIRRYWQSEPKPVRSIRYVDEGEKLRGTGGALRLASEQAVLDESFLVIYGDSFLPVDFAPVWRAFDASGMPALMTVLRNQGRWDRSNVIYDNGRVTLYDKRGDPRMQYIDYGLSAFRRELFDHAPEVSDLALLLHQLSLQGKLAGFEVAERFYEIGSPQGLSDLEHYLEIREAEAVGKLAPLE